MIYKFRIVSGEVEDFFRDIEIKSDQTFLDFHNAIQVFCKYDKSQMASFFISDENWEKGEEIMLMDMYGDENSDIHMMEESKLSDFITGEDDKLLYVFDFFSERGFFIELMGVSEENPENTYPVCTNAKGKAPEQIMMDDAEDMFDEARDEFDDLFEEDDMFGDDDDLYGNGDESYGSNDEYDDYM